MTLSTSDMNKAKMKWRPVWGYALISAFCIAVNFIYAQFSHGVSSTSMTWMFLYPLLGGSGFFALLKITLPDLRKWKFYRIFFNMHNSGIATLTTGAFLKGIFIIAGTSSSYTRMIILIGWTFVVVGFIILFLYLLDAGKQRSISRRKQK